MDYCSIFIGSGMALFIALLAWGNQISKQREDIIQIENSFIRSFGMNKERIIPLIRDPSKYSFINIMSAIIDCVIDDNVDQKLLDIRKDIIAIQKIFKSLTNCYLFRYYASILLTAISFLFGTYCYMYKQTQVNIVIQTSMSSILLFIYFTLIFIILITFIFTNSKEKEFIDFSNGVLDRLENQNGR